MTSYPQIFLRPSKAGALEGGHPWVLDKSVIEPTAPINAGTIVDVTLPDGRFVARGIYNPASRIRVRVYQWDSAIPLDEEWLTHRLQLAVDLRRDWQLGREPFDAVRLVNSEGDGLSGLIVDRFGQYIVVQVTACAMRSWLPTITSWLIEHFHPNGILLRVDQRIGAAEGMDLREQTLFGELPHQAITIEEYGVRIQFDLGLGQKTGYYLDQRENRVQAARWIRGGRMLDVCCYLGGFSLAAAKWGSPTEILAIDTSRRAIELAQLNANLNSIDGIVFKVGDCFEELESLSLADERFQSVVLDPPRMAGSRQQKDAALRAYHKLNSLAMKLITPGGILVSCSCSGRVSREEFTRMLAVAATRVGRHVQVLEQRGAATDHPINLSCPESEYLKCFICRVE